ncbi:hypothetical protein HDU96_000888 [Phlyctochytrium bullatum]|nr:hypothetical protein HDU96_000888 [Phlyctochytrium bullatum]
MTLSRTTHGGDHPSKVDSASSSSASDSTAPVAVSGGNQKPARRWSAQFRSPAFQQQSNKNGSGFMTASNSSGGKLKSLFKREKADSASTVHDEATPVERDAKPALTDDERRRRRRTICIRVCVIISVLFLVFAAIFIPIFCLVLIPQLIQSNFANTELSRSGGESGFVLQSIAFESFDNSSMVVSFGAKINGISIPFNIPVDLKRPSDWGVDGLTNDASDPDIRPTWKNMAKAPETQAEFYIRDGKGTLDAKQMRINIPKNGTVLSDFGAGITQVFAANDPNIVPKLSLQIVAGFKVGLLHVRTIPLNRVLDVGQLLLNSGFLSNSPSSSTPAPNQPTVSTINVPSGSPVGLHLSRIAFDLVADNNVIARVRVSRLNITVGDNTVDIPMSVDLNLGGTVNALIGQGSLLLGGLRTLGLKNVSALTGDGRSVVWLDNVLRKVDFRVPLSKLTSAASSVLSQWILSLFIRT